MSAARFAIVSTGTEILQGMYVDTNARDLAAALTAEGYEVAAIVAAPDKGEAIEEALRGLFGRAEMIVTTGGLGPTFDDTLRQTAARVWQAPLVYDEEAWRMIEERFRGRGRKLPDSNRVQAFIPQGAIPLYNDCGTAPGFILPAGAGRPALAALPGPPREMEPMFTEKLLPWIREALPVRNRQAIFEILTTGLPESEVNERVADLVGARPGVDLALLASGGSIRVRLTLRAESDEALAALRDAKKAEIESRVGPEPVWGYDDDTLETVVGRRLAELGLKIAVAESCTGGMVNAALTSMPGASAYLERGFVVYANAAKQEMLGVREETLAAHGAVSAETAAEMAEGTRRAAKADIALAVTGIAGPSGATPEKPVGLVWYGVATAKGVETFEFRFPGNRGMVRAYATTRGLDLVRRRLDREFTHRHDTGA